MALPIILGIGAGIAALTGVGSGISGGVKIKNASDTMKKATEKRDAAIKRFESSNAETTKEMDKLGKKELDICASFQEFADVIELIQGRPDFKEIGREYVGLPEYNATELKRVAVGASVLAAGVGGATAGVAGGFAAAGITTSAVMALGTASTGTAIASLSGAAATNATLAALGGGSLAVGGGGIALGTTVLGVSTAGVGIMIGGIIFNITGSSLSKKADKAYYQALEIERNVSDVITYLVSLKTHAKMFYSLLNKVNKKYEEQLKKLKEIVLDNNKCKWTEYTIEEKTVVENAVLLVGLLYRMCKVNLVLKDDDGDGQNTVNTVEIEECMSTVENIMEEKFAA